MKTDSDIIKQVALLVNHARAYNDVNYVIKQIDQLYRKHYRERLVERIKVLQSIELSKTGSHWLPYENALEAIKQELSDDT